MPKKTSKGLKNYEKYYDALDSFGHLRVGRSNKSPLESNRQTKELRESVNEALKDRAIRRINSNNDSRRRAR